MDFFSKSINKISTTDSNDNTNKTPNEHKPTSTSDLFASAKVLAEAVKGGGGEQNNEKIADASGDLLSAAAEYGKIDETSTIGKSVHQAEEYLHNYNSSSSSPPTSQSSTTTTNTTDSTPSTETPVSTPSTKVPDSTPESDGGSEAESGGGYLKMAEGLFNRK